MNHQEEIQNKARELIQTLNVLVEDCVREMLLQQQTFHDDYFITISALSEPGSLCFIPLGFKAPSPELRPDKAVQKYHNDQLTLLKSMVELHDEASPLFRFLTQVEDVLSNSVFFAKHENLNNDEREMAKSHSFELIIIETLPAYFSQVDQLFDQVLRHLTDINLRQYDVEASTLLSGSDLVLPENFPGPDEALVNDALLLFFNQVEKAPLAHVAMLKKSRIHFLKHKIEVLSRSRPSTLIGALKKTLNLRSRAAFVFFDDWRFRHHLFAFAQHLLFRFTETEQHYREIISKGLIPLLQNQQAYLSGLLSELDALSPANMEELKDFMMNKLQQLKSELAFNLDDHSALRIDVPEMITNFEKELREALSNFPKKTAVVQQANYLEGFQASAVHYFSPSAFIGYQIIDVFSANNEKLRKKMQFAFNNVSESFNDFDENVAYFLNSALGLSINTQLKVEEILEVFRDGLQRSLKISSYLEQQVQLLETELPKKLREGTEEMLQSLIELDDNTNILSIYRQLLQSKALKSSVEKQHALFRKVKDQAGKLKAMFDVRFSGLGDKVSEVRKLLKLSKDRSGVSAEISIYLSDVNKNIDALPRPYQYLFSNMPIREMNLFQAREKELGLVFKAFDAWKKGNYAATLLVGEKGSGKTSFLNFFRSQLPSDVQIDVVTCDELMYRSEHYDAWVNQLFPGAQLSSDQSIAAYVEAMEFPRIIMVDGMERLFMRRIEGFQLMRNLLLLILATNQKIFWLCSFSKHAFDYLNKTIALSDYFDYQVSMDGLSTEMISRIIRKRNRIGGYRLTYQYSTKEEQKPAGEKATQDELEEEFFNELGKFAGNNIALSMQYWLESIESIEEELVSVKKFEIPDFGFLESLSEDKLYALLIIVIHGKITANEFALIGNMQIHESLRILNVLKEDNVLIKQGNDYKLNGMLYRHVTRLLMSRNLIN